MDLYIFSDESGIFDSKHYDLFVYAGLIIIGKQDMDMLSRRYLGLEKNLRKKTKYKNTGELKARHLDDCDRKKLLKLFSRVLKFAVLVDLKKLDQEFVFKNQKSKQRYMDFAYQTVLRKAFELMLHENIVKLEEELSIFIHEDNHHIATGIKCSKEEAIFQDLQSGTYVPGSGMFIPPLFPNLQKVSVTLHDSVQATLIRGADLIANTVYVSAMKDNTASLSDIPLLLLTNLP